MSAIHHHTMIHHQNKCVLPYSISPEHKTLTRQHYETSCNIEKFNQRRFRADDGGNRKAGKGQPPGTKEGLELELDGEERSAGARQPLLESRRVCCRSSGARGQGCAAAGLGRGSGFASRCVITGCAD